MRIVCNYIIRFNDNINQIKLYIYVNNNNFGELLPDVSYLINENAKGNLIINDSEVLLDKTPYSTEYSTQFYKSNNKISYLIKYVATKRAADHQEKFENILSSFKFLK